MSGEVPRGTGRLKDRQCAVCYTDIGSAYAQVIPKNRHKAVGKETPINQSYKTL